jgi:excisionase family DNA binding protein
MEQINRYLSVSDTAKYLGVSKETIYRLLKSKNIPASRIGKLWKFNTKDLDTWVRKGSKK